MKKNIIKIAIVFAVATSGTLFISCGNTTSSQSQTQTQVQEQTPRYKNVSTAINDGTIYYGMTFEEIVEICGYPSDGVTKENGKVRNAYYNGGNFVLRFDHGRWNGRYTEY